MSINANAIVAVNPGVLAAGGDALNLSGLLLTTNTAIPLGTVQQFGDGDAVEAFFGSSSTEARLANIYFNGFDNKTATPGTILMSQYNTAAVAAYLRSASIADLTLADIQAIAPGTLTITVNGVAKTTASVDLSAASSFSNAAALISAGFTGGPVVAYDSQRAAFTFTSGTTGAASTIGFGTGTLATALRLTSALGAVTSQGAIAATPVGAMDAITLLAQNWASFMTTFEPLLADKLLFAGWTDDQNDRFVYVGWDTDVNAIVSGNTTAFGPQLGILNLSGSMAIYDDIDHAAFAMGCIASINFDATNGRTTLAFRTQGGLVPSVEDKTIADILTANGYNFVGDYATSSEQFTFFYDGQISGPFAFTDSYVNQIWLNSRFQGDMLRLLIVIGSIPYNAEGRAQIEQSLSDTITAGLNFGAIRIGVELSGTQKASVNAAAGVPIDVTLSTRGWYLKVGEASPEVRAVRGSPPCTFWYMDGGSIQKLTLASIALQ